MDISLRRAHTQVRSYESRTPYDFVKEHNPLVQRAGCTTCTLEPTYISNLLTAGRLSDESPFLFLQPLLS